MAAEAEGVHIFGLHDSAGAKGDLDEVRAGIAHMREMGRQGWFVFSVMVGRDPTVLVPHDYSEFAQDVRVIVRLNHGYGDQGSLPYEQDYWAFAQCCRRFVELSRGVNLWVIGNETNLSGEWPKYGGREEPITPARYVACFRMVREAIKSVGPQHQVILQALTPGPSSQGVPPTLEYYYQMIGPLAAEQLLDGIALHTGTVGWDPPDLPFQENFRMYQHFLRMTPSKARFLPVYITETNPGLVNNAPSWPDHNSGWIKNAYLEIDKWNRVPAHQSVRALALYHWVSSYHPKFSLKPHTGSVNDFNDAMQNRHYRWNTCNYPHGRYFIQSSFGKVGNFEVVVSAAPERGMIHYWRNNDDPNLPWIGPIRFATDIERVEAVAFIQGAHKLLSGPYEGNFEVMARVNDRLAHFYRDENGSWKGPTWFATGVTGAPVLIQSRLAVPNPADGYDYTGWGNFELVVPLAAGGVAHFWRNNDDRNKPWYQGATFGSGRIDAVALIQSSFGRLEVVTRTDDKLWHWWRDDDNIWRGPTQIVDPRKPASETGTPMGTPGFMQARYTRPGNFVLLTPIAEKEGGIARWARDNSQPETFPWVYRERIATGRPYAAVSVLQSNFGRQGNLEFVARRSDTRELEHWYYDTDVTPAIWRGPTVNLKPLV